MILITKGEPTEQEHKISRSGIAGFFRHIEIVGEKNQNSYQTILRRYNIDPKRFLMLATLYAQISCLWLLLAHEQSISHNPTHGSMRRSWILSWITPPTIAWTTSDYCPISLPA